MAIENQKRKRKKPNRYGNRKINKDHYFQNKNVNIDDNSDNSCKIDNPNVSEIDSSNAEKIVSSNAEKIDSSNVLQKQISRIEAKVNNMQRILSQIHRMLIANSIGRCNDGSIRLSTESVAGLPLLTIESFNKFENDLNDRTFREQIVSMKKNLNLN